MLFAEKGDGEWMYKSQQTCSGFTCACAVVGVHLSCFRINSSLFENQLGYDGNRIDVPSLLVEDVFDD